MKREIKFRGKRVDNGEWVYGDLLQMSDAKIIYTRSNIKGEPIELGVKKIGVFLPLDKLAVVQRDTVGQFTGLYGRDGKDIYEGDIVQSFTNWGDFGKVGVVEFSDGRFRLNVNGILSKYKDFVDEEEWDDMGARMKVKYTYKVIGNINENHELLNDN